MILSRHPTILLRSMCYAKIDKKSILWQSQSSSMVEVYVKLIKFFIRFLFAVVAFDKAIFERIEGFCYKTQRLIGWTNFTWLRLAWAFLGCALGIIAIFSPAQPESASFTEQCLTIAIPGLIFGMLGSCLETIRERESEELLAKGLANPLKEDFFVITFGRGCVMSILFFYPPLWLVVFVTLIITYLLQCDPLPPCDSKLRQWFQSLFLTPARIRQ